MVKELRDKGVYLKALEQPSGGRVEASHHIIHSPPALLFSAVTIGLPVPSDLGHTSGRGGGTAHQSDVLRVSEG